MNWFEGQLSDTNFYVAKSGKWSLSCWWTR